MAWPGVAGWNGLSLDVKTKGKVKVSGTLADGTKVSDAGYNRTDNSPMVGTYILKVTKSSMGIQEDATLRVRVTRAA